MTEPQTASRTKTALILIGVALLLAIALLAVPGYIAGYYCKFAHDDDSMYAIESYFLLPPGSRARPNIVLQISLAPAWLAMNVSPSLRRIYWRQFVVAADVVTDVY